jgi:hypothetical protein
MSLCEMDYEMRTQREVSITIILVYKLDYWRRGGLQISYLILNANTKCNVRNVHQFLGEFRIDLP